LLILLQNPSVPCAADRTASRSSDGWTASCRRVPAWPWRQWHEPRRTCRNLSYMCERFVFAFLIDVPSPDDI